MKRSSSRTALACCAVLAACGGGGGDAAVAPSIAGLYEGSGGSNRASELLILDSGRYYLVYGLGSASATPVGGVIVGDGSASDTTFASANAHDFNLQSHTLLTATLSSTIASMASASTAVVRSDGSSATYGGTYNATSGNGASLATLAGTYGGELVGLADTLPSVLTIDMSGVLAGTTSASCSYAGIAMPHGGANAYDVTLNLRSGCPNAGSTLHGHAFLSGKVLYLVAATGDLTGVTLFSGVKP